MPAIQEPADKQHLLRGAVPAQHEIDRPRDLRTQIDVFCTTRNYKKCEIYRAVIAARYMEEME